MKKIFLIAINTNDNDLLDCEVEEYTYLQGAYSSKEIALDKVKEIKEKLLNSTATHRKQKAYEWTEEETKEEIENMISLIEVSLNKDYYSKGIPVELASFNYSE